MYCSNAVEPFCRRMSVSVAGGENSFGYIVATAKHAIATGRVRLRIQRSAPAGSISGRSCVAATSCVGPACAATTTASTCAKVPVKRAARNSGSSENVALPLRQ